MTPCMRLYAWLARELQAAASPDGPCREWLETYADPAFEQLATTLEGLLDRLGADPEVVAGHYRTAVPLELAFFGAADERAP